MLIVSQSKKTVTNLSAMESIVVGEGNAIRTFVCGCNAENENYYEIGSYDNEAKAKGVLKQLWSAYNNGEKVFIMPENKEE